MRFPFSSNQSLSVSRHLCVRSTPRGRRRAVSLCFHRLISTSFPVSCALRVAMCRRHLFRSDSATVILFIFLFVRHSIASYLCVRVCLKLLCVWCCAVLCSTRFNPPVCLLSTLLLPLPLLNPPRTPDVARRLVLSTPSSASVLSFCRLVGAVTLAMRTTRDEHGDESPSSSCSSLVLSHRDRFVYPIFFPVGDGRTVVGVLCRL